MQQRLGSDDGRYATGPYPLRDLAVLHWQTDCTGTFHRSNAVEPGDGHHDETRELDSSAVLPQCTCRANSMLNNAMLEPALLHVRL
jgi:hypothetical protein